MPGVQEGITHSSVPGLHKCSMSGVQDALTQQGVHILP